MSELEGLLFEPGALASFVDFLNAQNLHSEEGKPMFFLLSHALPYEGLIKTFLLEPIIQEGVL